MSQEKAPPDTAIDSDAEELPAEPPAVPVQSGVALAPRPPAERQVLMPLDPQQVVEGMRQYQQLLRDLLDPSDWQTKDKNGRPLERPFLKKSGWRKIARAFNLSFERVHTQVERDDDGNPVRAEVWIRAVAPNGQYGDGDGYCSLEEGRFKSSRGRAKLENDLRATATTRAKNRAIADLVGMGEVSAEELDPDSEQKAVTAPCDEELAARASAALVYLAGANETAADVWSKLAENAGGELPALCAHTILACARAAHNRDQQGGGGATAEAPPGVAATAAERVSDVLDLARRAGYRAHTIRALSALLYERESLAQLADGQLTDLERQLANAHAGGVGNDRLAKAIEHAANRPDPPAGRESLRRWLSEQADGQAEAA